MKRFIERIRASIDIPFEPLSELRNKENIVVSLINFGVLIILLYLLPAIVTRGFGSQQILSTVTLLAIFWLARWTIRKGFVNQVSLILLFISWLFVMYLFLFLENGLRAPVYSVMIAFLISYAGLLHGRYGGEASRPRSRDITRPLPRSFGFAS